MKAGKWTLIIVEIEGFNLLVPTSYRDATNEKIDAHTGGCGPGGLGDYLVPDTNWGESMFLACRPHDWMYWEGETPEDKVIADLVFIWNMLIVIQTIPYTPYGIEDQTLDIIRLRRIMTYYTAVSYGGGRSFSKGVTPKKEDIEYKFLVNDTEPKDPRNR